MVKSLLENQTLFLEKYLHELIPAVTTCIVARQLCTRPDVDNHWALRDFASRLMANICKNFNTSTNNIQTRVTRMFCEALRSEKTPLVSYYGALAGLQELGQEVIKTLIIPQLSAIAARIDSAMDANVSSLSSNPSVDKKALEHIKNLIKKHIAPVWKNTVRQPITPGEIRNEYGSLGPLLFDGIQRLQSSNPQQSNLSSASAKQSQIPPGSIPQQPLGMISHKKSLITIFGQKHKIKNFIKKFDIFH